MGRVVEIIIENYFQVKIKMYFIFLLFQIFF
ncbi:MAG: hypothetical protein RL757_283 [Bacteroidota bacterium]|jgi:hypothetical protein